MTELQAINSNHDGQPLKSSVGPDGDKTDDSLKPNIVDGSTQGQVMQQVQGLMHELEEKREADKRIVDEFRSRMQEMVDQLCHQLEERMLNRQQETNKEVQSKRLNEVLERVCGIESEMDNFKSALGNLFKSLH